MTMDRIEALKKIHATLGSIVGGDEGVDMTFDKFIAYTQAQIDKAITEPVTKSAPRLRALRACIEKAVSDIGVMSATNTTSESIRVTVYTEEVTNPDPTLEERSPASIPANSGPSFTSFAKSAAEAAAAVKKALDAAPAVEAGKPAETPAEKPADKVEKKGAALARNDGVDDEGWPEDLNDPKYRETRKSASAPVFGYDNDPVV
jgi:hypothetical protein